MSWPWRNHQRPDLQFGKVLRGNGVVSDDNDISTDEAQRLVEVPGERVEVVDHQNFDRTSEMGGERHRFVSSKRGYRCVVSMRVFSQRNPDSQKEKRGVSSIIVGGFLNLRVDIKIERADRSEL